MTEEEAKTKWCPKYQVATSGADIPAYEMDNRPHEWIEDGKKENGGIKYRRGRVMDHACCIASACMAWRFDKGVDGDDQIIDLDDVERWKKAGWRVIEITNDKVKVGLYKIGYCGLAGKP